jgi:hypothetical protein
VLQTRYSVCGVLEVRGLLEAVLQYIYRWAACAVCCCYCVTSTFWAVSFGELKGLRVE